MSIDVLKDILISKGEIEKYYDGVVPFIYGVR